MNRGTSQAYPRCCFLHTGVLCFELVGHDSLDASRISRFAFAHRSYLFEISWTLKAVHVLAKHFRGIRVFAPEFLIKKQQQNNLESTERGC